MFIVCSWLLLLRYGIVLYYRFPDILYDYVTDATGIKATRIILLIGPQDLTTTHETNTETILKFIFGIFGIKYYISHCLLLCPHLCVVSISKPTPGIAGHLPKFDLPLACWQFRMLILHSSRRRRTAKIQVFCHMFFSKNRVGSPELSTQRDQA